MDRDEGRYRKKVSTKTQRSCWKAALLVTSLYGRNVYFVNRLTQMLVQGSYDQESFIRHGVAFCMSPHRAGDCSLHPAGIVYATPCPYLDL